MKKLCKMFLFGGISLGACVLWGNSQVATNNSEITAHDSSVYTSLRKQSPFGDQAPKPEPPKKVVDPSKKQAADVAKAPAKPKIPERKITVSGFCNDNTSILFSVVDKTDKDPVFQQVPLNGTSPKGYNVKKFDKKSNAVTIVFGGHEYHCVIGDDGEKKNDTDSRNSNNSGNRNNNYNGKGSSSDDYYNYDGYGSYGPSPYYFLDDDWDDWDDWDY